LTELKINGKVNKRVKNILYRANTFKSLDYTVEDKIERRNNLRELLALFSPVPSINFKSGRQHDKKEYELLMDTMKKCNKGAGHGAFVEPIKYSRASILVVLDLSKRDSKLFHHDNVRWYRKHLETRLGVKPSSINYTSVLKCSHFNVEKKDINSECRNMCLREFLAREIEILRPRIVINCVSMASGFLAGDSKLNFQESFGNIYFNGNLDSYVINSPSPQWLSYCDTTRSMYEKDIMPLLKSLNADQS